MPELKLTEAWAVVDKDGTIVDDANETPALFWTEKDALWIRSKADSESVLPVVILSAAEYERLKGAKQR